MSKPNIRSFRYSDKVAEILDSHRGDTLNEKFENLVSDCFLMIEERKEALAKVNAEIAARRETLRNLERATWELSQLEGDIQRAKQTFGIVERRAKAIAEKME